MECVMFAGKRIWAGSKPFWDEAGVHDHSRAAAVLVVEYRWCAPAAVPRELLLDFPELLKIPILRPAPIEALRSVTNARNVNRVDLDCANEIK